MGESKIQNLKSKILMVVIAVAVFVADQMTKSLAERRIPDRAVIPVVRGFFNLTNTKNSGAVFGMFSEVSAWWKTPLLIVISAALLIVVVTLVIRTKNLRWETSVGLSLILGGALSNLFDRVRAGMVEDFLDFYIRSYHWATFNLADSAIVVGTGLIVVQVLFID
jgi:signal peptidase II